MNKSLTQNPHNLNNLTLESSSPITKNSNKSLVIVLLLSLLITILGLIFLLQQNQLLKKQLISLENQIHQLTQASTPETTTDSLKSNEQDRFENWRVYRNEEIGFQLKYPPSWHTYYDLSIPVTNSDVIYLHEQYYPDIDVRGLTHGLPGSFMILLIELGNEKESWKLDYFEKVKDPNYQPSTDVNGEVIQTKEIIQLNNTEVYKIINFKDDGKATLVGGLETLVFFSNKGRLVIFRFPNEYNEFFDEVVYDRIFSTLEIF